MIKISLYDINSFRAQLDVLFPKAERYREQANLFIDYLYKHGNVTPSKGLLEIPDPVISVPNEVSSIVISSVCLELLGHHLRGDVTKLGNQKTFSLE